MRWYEIDLNLPGIPSGDADTRSDGPPTMQRGEAVQLLAEAKACVDDLPQLQSREGIDSPAVVKRMVEVGQMLFHVVTLDQPYAFSRRRARVGISTPYVGVAEADHVVGYHLTVPTPHTGLPWIWLHNGVGFLLEKHAICASHGRSGLPDMPHQVPWMGRLQDTRLIQQIQGEQPLRQILPRLRPSECADPEILFVPEHCDEKIRRLLYREADAIGRALAAGALGRPLAKLKSLAETVTPAWLAQRGGMYQGLHHAGPTAQPAESSTPEPDSWLECLLTEGDQFTADPVVRPVSTDLDSGTAGDLPVDLELELVGVDPITALLDTVAVQAEAGGETALAGEPPVKVTTTLPRGPWWLEDGPVRPEDLGKRGAMPPLVFSNSYRSLCEMNIRFLNAGASVFIGTVAPLYSRPARKYAGRFYNFMADGHSAATALRMAALACRSEYGADHPAWLSYGIVGYGSLALQYL